MTTYKKKVSGYQTFLCNLQFCPIGAETLWEMLIAVLGDFFFQLLNGKAKEYFVKALCTTHKLK
jgi:hypothetical protein